jgi:hypothetical protein
MNKNFIIILFFAMIIVGVVIYTNSKDEKDSGDDKPETLSFEVVGITVSKTENYKPWFTERYTADEYVAMSQGAKFTYTFRINGGVDLLQNLSITRKRADGGSDQIEEVPESDWMQSEPDNLKDINVDFSVQTGENAKGEHEFSINYTTPDDNVTRNRPHTINITENLLSVKLESGGSEELEMVPVETGGINVAFSAEREEIYIYDSEKVVNFNAQGPVYMSPVEGTNGKGFKLEGTGITDTLYRVKYRGGYLLALSENANFTDTEYLSTDKSKKKFTDGELNNKLFYITADANSATAAENFFFELAENVGSSGSTISNGREEIFSTPGTYTWVAPTGVTSVCVVCVGGGGASGKGRNWFGTGGAGGGLAYKNDITVVPGNSYSVSVGAGGAGYNGQGLPGSISSSNGGNSVFRWGDGWPSGACFASGGQHGGGPGKGYEVLENLPTGGGPEGTYDGGGTGGTCQGRWSSPPNYISSGGGGAGGYSGAGGKGAGSTGIGAFVIDATAGAGGGGGGGGARLVHATGASYGGAGGGGVGLYGEKSDGAAGLSDTTTTQADQVAANIAGGGGSGGGMGNLSTDETTGVGGSGGLYGGGAGSCHAGNDTGNGADGGNGAVRIIWGQGRSFPSNAD